MYDYTERIKAEFTIQDTLLIHPVIRLRLSDTVIGQKSYKIVSDFISYDTTFFYLSESKNIIQELTSYNGLFDYNLNNNGWFDLSYYRNAKSKPRVNLAGGCIGFRDIFLKLTYDSLANSILPQRTKLTSFLNLSVDVISRIIDTLGYSCYSYIDTATFYNSAIYTRDSAFIYRNATYQNGTLVLYNELNYDSILRKFTLKCIVKAQGKFNAKVSL